MRKFKKTYIEITNICNLSCDFCPKTARKPEFMKPELFERILKELQEHTKFVYFHVLGEPLLHPELGLFLDLSENYKLKVNITTNGTLINKVSDILLSKPALRQLNFSLHSFEANMSGHSIDEYLNNIFNFIDTAAKKGKLLTSLRLWNLEEGTNKEHNSYILRRIEDNFKLPFTIEETLTPCKGIKIGDNVFLNQAQRFDWPDISFDTSEDKGFCYGLRDQIAILVDGTIVPCCLDSEGVINLGNIKNNNLSDIVESYKAKEIYEGFSRRKAVESLCKRCTYRNRFNV